jgi:hypothetical protein
MIEQIISAIPTTLGFGGFLWLFKRWIDRVDNSLIVLAKALNDHLIQEEGFRVLLEVFSKDILDLKEDNRKVEAELKKYRVRESHD